MIPAGSTVELDVEKPAAGGRMLARHQGQIVLVANAIPGERVRARVERAAKSVAFAETIDVIAASPDRRPAGDWRCGGHVLAHVAYPRQLQLKGQIIQDAFARIGRMPLPVAPDVMASPEHGYRMRARLHARSGRFGFYREGTHELCDPEPAGQLLPATIAWIRRVESSVPPADADRIRGLEISEDIGGGQRAAYLDIHDVADAGWFSELAGPAEVVDRLTVPGGEPIVLRRSARSFFQGNRFLLEPMAHHVVSRVPAGAVVDLYAGVGLFGLSLAARGTHAVTLVEGDQASGADLIANARPYGDRVQVMRTSVEAYLGMASASELLVEPRPTFVIDPPRTGLSTEALAGLLRRQPARIVYVSCDVATLARDARSLLDGGYEIGSLTGFDLFPNTAHVETVIDFVWRT